MFCTEQQRAGLLPYASDEGGVVSKRVRGVHAACPAQDQEPPPSAPSAEDPGQPDLAAFDDDDEDMSGDSSSDR